MPTTALQMVNRVLMRANRNTVTSVTTAPGNRILALVNDAKEDILESFDWPFLYRSDGVVVTQPKWTHSDYFVSNGNTGLLLQTNVTSISQDPFLWDGQRMDEAIVWRAQFTASADYPESTFKIVSGGPGTNVLICTIEAPWPGEATLTSDSLTIFAAEYLLPRTVGTVYSVKYEEDDLHLEIIDEAFRFNRYVPRFHEEFGEPERVMVGGSAVASYATDAVGEPTETFPVQDAYKRLVVWPPSDDEYVIRYDYRYVYPRLAAETEDLDGVPEHIVTDICELAYVKGCYSHVFNDVTTGRALERQNARAVADHFRRSDPDAGRHKTLQSLDHIGRRSGRDIGRLPDDRFGSL